MKRLTFPLGELAVLLVAFALRVFRLGFQELRGDEAFGYFFTQQSYADIVRRTLALREPHPVASYFVAKAWTAWAGDSEFALRFVSLWGTVLAVALIYRLARGLDLSRTVALGGATLAAFSPYVVWHAQDARMYGMSLALTLGSTWLMLLALRHRRWIFWGVYVLVSWAALHTHYYAVFVLLAQNAFVLGRVLTTKEERSHLGSWLVAQLILVVLYLPWLAVARNTLTSYGGTGDSPALLPMLHRAMSVLVLGESAPQRERTLASILCGLLVFVGIVRLSLSGARGRRPAGLLALYLGVPLAATWLSAQGRPIFNERYLVAAAPPCYLLLAAAVAPKALDVARAATARWRLVVANGALAAARVSLALLCAVTMLALYRHYADPAYSQTIGWRPLARALDRLSGGMSPDTVRLVENFPDPTLWYYYRGPAQHLVLPPVAHGAGRTADEVARLVAGGVRYVVLVVQPAASWDDAGLAASALADRYHLVEEAQIAVWPVQVYVRAPERLPEVKVVFANGLVLDRGAVEPASLPPGGLLAVHLSWAGEAPNLADTTKMTIQVLDANGRLVAQSDRPFETSWLGAAPVSYGILLSDGLASGVYQTVLAIYDPGQSGAPRLLTAGGADAVVLGSITVSSGRN